MYFDFEEIIRILKIIEYACIANFGNSIYFYE